MSPALKSALATLPEYLGSHVLLSTAALVLGLAISLPLALAAIRVERLRWPLLMLASLIQTIPGLALLALFYPILLALSALLQEMIGVGVSALGFLPALIALTLYSMLPIIRNTVTAVTSLDPAIIEAARGVGMTDRQRLLKVELPLAAPVIMAGIRTAAVWVIGTATLATPVGQASLGNYIFAGLQTENWVWVLFGCVAAALLALVIDQLLGLIESGATRRSRARVLLGLGGFLAVVLAATAPVAIGHIGPRQPSYVIGAKNFSEQYILAALMADRLEAGGARVTQSSGLGSAVIFRALANDEIDAYVDYSGTLWANVMHRTDQPPRAKMLAEMKSWLHDRYGVAMLGSLGFENAYALAMRRDRAASLGIYDIADLAGHSADMAIGSDYEFFVRPEWQALRNAYGLGFARKRQYQSTFMYRALMNGDVDVITAFSSDGRITANDLLVLTDGKGAIPPYDAVVLVAPHRVNDRRLMNALAPLIGRINIGMMRKANMMVDREKDKLTPGAAARWIEQEIGLIQQ